MSEIDHAPVLRRGATGEWVTYLQQLLFLRGPNTYAGAVDGKFDSDVEAAVKRFQREMRSYIKTQPQDGVVTQQVWQELNREASGGETADINYGIAAADFEVETEGGSYEGRVAWRALATKDKLAPGREVGRHDWVAGSLQCTIIDFKGGLYSGPVYVVFEAIDGSRSDEGQEAHRGTATFPNIWLPSEGHLRLVVEGHDQYLEGSFGQFNLRKGDTNLSIHAEQEHEVKNVTVSEAQAAGWLNGMRVQGGLKFKVTGGPLELGWEQFEEYSHQESHTNTRTVSELVTVRLSTPKLKITQTG